MLWVANKMAAQSYFLGVDVGGTKVHAVLTDSRGVEVGELTEATKTQGGAALAEQIAYISKRLAARVGGEVVGTCIGLPASVDPEENSLSIVPNLENMEGRSFFDLIRAQLGPQVQLENDVNTAALAEYDRAATPSLAFIAIGTGIGMGLVLEGKIWRGTMGAAGEIALLPLGGDVEDALARGSGALEECLGGDGWRKAYTHAGGQSDQALRQLFEGTDLIFTQILEQQANLLARALLTVSAVIAPQSFVLGGSIGSQPRLLAALERQLPRYFAHPPQVRISALGNRAGAVGAARVAAVKFGALASLNE